MLWRKNSRKHLTLPHPILLALHGSGIYPGSSRLLIDFLGIVAPRRRCRIKKGIECRRIRAIGSCLGDFEETSDAKYPNTDNSRRDLQQLRALGATAASH